jgi:hypothetical protein
MRRSVLVGYGVGVLLALGLALAPHPSHPVSAISVEVTK